MKAERCDNCHYSKPFDGYRVFCRRFPPTVSNPSSSLHDRSEPMVTSNGWCGEWKAHGHRVVASEPETPQERMWKWFWR